MKKAIFFAITLFLLSCSGNKEKSIEDVEKLLREMHTGSTETIDGLTVEYDERNHDIEYSWKGELLTVSYKTQLYDITSDEPKMKADRFLISSVVFYDNIKTVSHLEVVISGVKLKAKPSSVEKLDKIICLGFSDYERSFCEMMEVLSKINEFDAAYLVTDKGNIKIPNNDIINLISMAMNYKLDGGSFEYK